MAKGKKNKVSKGKKWIPFEEFNLWQSSHPVQGFTTPSASAPKSPSKTAPTLSFLPTEILENIMGNLGLGDATCMALTCNRFYSILKRKNQGPISLQTPVTYIPPLQKGVGCKCRQRYCLCGAIQMSEQPLWRRLMEWMGPSYRLDQYTGPLPSNSRPLNFFFRPLNPIFLNINTYGRALPSSRPGSLKLEDHKWYWEPCRSRWDRNYDARLFAEFTRFVVAREVGKILLFFRFPAAFPWGYRPLVLFRGYRYIAGKGEREVMKVCNAGEEWWGVFLGAMEAELRVNSYRGWRARWSLFNVWKREEKRIGEIVMRVRDQEMEEGLRMLGL